MTTKKQKAGKHNNPVTKKISNVNRKNKQSQSSLHFSAKEQNENLQQQLSKTANELKKKKEETLEKAEESYNQIMIQFQEAKKNFDDTKTFIMSNYSTHAKTFQDSKIQVDKLLKEGVQTIQLLHSPGTDPVREKCEQMRKKLTQEITASVSLYFENLDRMGKKSRKSLQL